MTVQADRINKIDKTDQTAQIKQTDQTDQINHRDQVRRTLKLNLTLKWGLDVLVFGVLPVIMAVISMSTGRFEIPAGTVFEILFRVVTGQAPLVSTDLFTIVMEIRLPRTFLAMATGSALAVSGAAYQALFRNPLASPGILGVSSGAGFGAAISILLFGTMWTPVFAFAFGVVAVAASYLVGRVYKSASTSTIMLVLGGTVISSIFSALLQLVKYVADPLNKLPAITFWLMGSLSAARSQDILMSSIPMGLGLVGLILLSFRLNVVSMGDREARSLGINVKVMKFFLIGFATLATAGAVSVSGVVGWIGLVIPHVGRMLVGNDNRKLIPASISLGASFMLLVDTICRTLTGAEIPLGIVTALVGGPFFIYLLKRTKGENWV
ncbi:FecCD family ABC transporter permease [Acidaminobacter hydrogenoformans]|uniref:Iron complex transport system permease protein n=1 Tax=Acidaminobacter hydrogenoformans DSM 2784 TaxID=1120920 RepID=A0A1G5S659_9FIRM|nr:iron ABC transporter permease [Acidaminobacter hydrogenoformans]SCZ81824.1 iron complex transport system permease protein [Acidaminobacter hydrogenoformans DSM 2784]